MEPSIAEDVERNFLLSLSPMDLKLDPLSITFTASRSAVNARRKVIEVNFSFENISF